MTAKATSVPAIPDHPENGGDARSGPNDPTPPAGGSMPPTEFASAPSPASPQIGHSVKRGMTWSVVNTGASKVLSFLSFAILAILVSKEDFGLFALSFSIAAFVQIFRDGGVVQLLVQRGEAEYQSLRGPVFWMAFAFNSASALALALLAPLLVSAYGKPELFPLLLIIGLGMPLATPGVILQARLAMRLQFGTIARIQFISALIRYVGTVGLAALGFGPLSFVLPLPVIAIYESVAAYLATGESPWLSSARLQTWRLLFMQSRWLIFSALSTAAINQGAYLVLGAIVDDHVVGVFFLSYQLITQIDALLAATAGTVLFPALSRLAGEVERFRNATLRAARTIMFLAAPATAALLVGFDPLEDILWHGKWDAARWPTQALSLFYAARILFMVPGIALQAQGRFKACALLVLICGAGLMAATTIGALIEPTPESIALWLGGYIGVGCLAFSVYAMHLLGVPPSHVMHAVLPPWLTAVAAALAALGVDMVARPFLLNAGFVGDGLLDWMGLNLASRMWMPAALAGVLRLALAGLVLGAVYIVIMRVLFTQRLREGLHVAPYRFHGILERALRISLK